MKKLVAEGKSIILITHKLNEIMKVADKCTVIRKGKFIASVDVAETNEEQLAELMVGKNLSREIEKASIQPASDRRWKSRILLHSVQARSAFWTTLT